MLRDLAVAAEVVSLDWPHDKIPVARSRAVVVVNTGCSSRSSSSSSSGGGRRPHYDQQVSYCSTLCNRLKVCGTQKGADFADFSTTRNSQYVQRPLEAVL